jgi:hypothetical protein
VYFLALSAYFLSWGSSRGSAGVALTESCVKLIWFFGL